MNFVFRREGNFGGIPFRMVPTIRPCKSEEVVKVVICSRFVAHNFAIAPNTNMRKVEGIADCFRIPVIDCNQIPINNCQCFALR